MKIVKKIKSHFFNYTFIEHIATGESYNTNVKLQRNLDKSLWVGKISRPLYLPNVNNRSESYSSTGDLLDLNDRALLGFRLARSVGLNSLRVKIIPFKIVEEFDINTLSHARIDNYVFLTPFKGLSLPQYLASKSFSSLEESDIKNKEEAIRSFIFNLWIGNYDNKDKDYLVDNDSNLISIDYHLLGPTSQDNKNLSLGACGEMFDIDNSEDTGWCVGNGELLNYIKNNPNHRCFDDTINKINSISKRRIKLAMRDLHFYNQGTQQDINRLFLNFLIERQVKLKKTIKDWIKADYPIASLPKQK
jgi:hypothetical protein